MRAVAIIAVLLAGALPVFSEDGFHDELIKFNLMAGREHDVNVSRIEMASKIADIYLEANEKRINRQEFRFLAALFALRPTGREASMIGIAAKADIDERTEWDRDNEGIPAKMFLSYRYRWAPRSSLTVDIPLAYVRDGVRWYGAAKVEQELRLLRHHGYEAALYVRASYDLDPAVGFCHSEWLAIRRGMFELSGGPQGYAVRFGTGLGF